MRSRDSIVGFTALLLIGSAVRAQQHDDTGAGSAKLEEIVVTAQKREQNLQDVPIAVTAVTGESLERLGIGDLEELPLVTPGLHVSRVTAAPVIFIRGVGNNNPTPGNEASVATYIDGVYRPNANANIFSFNNLERVEVLKGPQGTLFGRNATGGVINIVTKDPTDIPTMKARLGYGRFDTLEANFYGSAGLGASTAADVALYYRDQGESPLENTVPGLNYAPDEVTSARTKWLFKLGDRAELRLIGFYDDFESSTGAPRQPLPGTIAATGFGYSGDFYTFPSDFITYSTVESKGGSAQLKYALSDSLELVSISGYVEDDVYFDFDNDGTAGFAQNSTQPANYETFTQELRLATTRDSTLDWTLGLFYYDNDSAWVTPGQVITTRTFSLASISEQQVNAWAVFGETHWQFADRTGLTLGLRWNRDELEHKGQTTFNGTGFPAYSQDDTFEKVTYRAGLDHRLTDEVMVYATYSRGYKSGVYNLTVTTPVAPPAIEPEIVDAAEIGMKADDLLGGRMRVNTAAFWYDYQDLQVLTIGTATQATANAAEATVKGAELEAITLLADSLRFTAGVAYLDTKYDQYFGVTNRPNVDVNGNPTGGNRANIPMDFKGKSLYRAPKWTVNTGLAYTRRTAAGTFGFDINYYYNDGFFWDSENRLKEPSYDLVNLELAWTHPGDRLKIGVWGRNVMDTEYSVFTNNSPSSGDAYNAGMPATYGAYVEYSLR